MKPENFTMTELEKEIWENELDDFLPEKLFDAHAHIWEDSFATPETPESGLRINAGSRTLHEFIGQFFPGRKANFQFVATPLSSIRFESERDWFLQETSIYAGDSGAILVTPETDPRVIARTVENNPRITALKPYFTFADSPWTASITDFILERLIEVADHYSLNIVLHLSKPAGIADEVNLSGLERLAGKYENVCWQLAHCARSFNGALLEKAVFRLRAMDHIFYDTSAVCDPYAFELLLKYEDRSRLVFGTDLLPGSAGRGKFVPYAQGWVFEPGGTHPWCRGEGISLIYEQLLALKRACRILDVGQNESNSIFYGNHCRFLARRKMK